MSDEKITWEKFLFSPLMMKSLSMQDLLDLIADPKLPLWAHDAFTHELMERKGMM